MLMYLLYMRMSWIWEGEAEAGKEELVGGRCERCRHSSHVWISKNGKVKLKRNLPWFCQWFCQLRVLRIPKDGVYILPMMMGRILFCLNCFSLCLASWPTGYLQANTTMLLSLFPRWLVPHQGMAWPLTAMTAHPVPRGQSHSSFVPV